MSHGIIKGFLPSSVWAKYKNGKSVTYLENCFFMDNVYMVYSIYLSRVKLVIIGVNKCL